MELLPYIIKVPLILRMLRSLFSSGKAVRAPSSFVQYSCFGVLQLFPIKSGTGQNPPVETIVTRVDMDRDPYEVTAICCTQIALALIDRDGDSRRDRRSGFQTPVNAIGGQEVLERCFECFRVQLVSRM